MRSKLALLSALAAGLSIVALGCGTEATSEPSQTQKLGAARAESPVADLVQPQPRPRGRFNHSGGCGGAVTAIGADWVEVRVAGEKQARRILTEGTKPGGDAKGLGLYETYQLTDLRVGDVVTILTGIDGKDDVCLAIWITRRPGGKIPRMPGQIFPEHDREWHVRNQAEQDWEEKGVPIPKRYLNPQGRAPWTNPPYPPVAPMPRAARP